MQRRRRKRTWWWMLLLPAAFVLGRWSVEPSPVALEETATDSPLCPPNLTSAPSAMSPKTSTIGLCPCPKPRLAKGLPIKRKPRELLATGPAKDRDPTARTAQYLREHARELASCAPKAGAEMRLHLEVTVTPEGRIEGIELLNLDPPPTEVADCVKKRMATLRPPGFDATSSETFALTVVL